MADTQFPRKMFKGDTGFPLGTLEIEVEVSDKMDGDKVCVRSVEGKPFSYPPEFRHPFDTVLQSDIYWSAYKWVRPDQLHDLPADWDAQLFDENAGDLGTHVIISGGEVLEVDAPPQRHPMKSRSERR
jgi:hypothetical protein